MPTNGSPDILVVEDESIVALDICKRLSELGYKEVRTARSAAKALSLANERAPDLALLDIQIDGSMDGVELGGELRSRWNAPIIYLTAYADPSTIGRAAKTLPYGYLLKPVNDRELRSTLQMALYRHAIEREREEADQKTRQLERQLLQNQKMQAIGQLTAGIAHELNNALMGVMGNISLTTTFGVLEDQDKTRLEVAMSGCQRSADLIKQLLDFARAGQYQPKVLDLMGVARAASHFLSQVWGARTNISIQGEEPLYPVLCDEAQMQQVITNILINAHEAARDSRPIELSFSNTQKDDPTSHNPDAKPGSYVALSISDSGEGIRAEDIPRIFEPFYSHKPRAEGTGLGLAVAYGIVQRHGGWIEVESQLGEGSTFTLYLPRHELAQNPVIAPARFIHKRASNRPPELLILDDEEIIVELLCSCFSDAGFKTHGFSEPTEALEWFKQQHHTIDLVILDMKMPTMDGSECFQRLRAIDPEANVFLFSGYARDESVQQLLAEGAQGFFEKPLDFNRMLGQVSELLDYSAVDARFEGPQ